MSTQPGVPSTPTNPTRVSNSPQDRWQRRTGTADNWRAGQYTKSLSGRYDPRDDPNRAAYQPVEPISNQGRMDFHDQISRRTGIIDSLGTQQNEVALQAQWEKERQRQQADYDAFRLEAEQLGGTPYQMGNRTYIQNMNVSDTGQIRNQLVPAATSMLTGARGNLIQAAQTMLGHKYAWGGGSASGPSRGILYGGIDGRNKYGFDCSGLVQYAFAQAGIQMPRVANQQAMRGKVVGFGALKPGDLVGWGSSPATAHHIAIYIGNGRIIEASVSSGVRIRALGSANDQREGFGISLGGF